MEKIDLTVVLPAYNEEENIEKSVKDALAVLPRFCNAYEVIVVNDGSHDQTGAIADRLAAEDPHVRVIHHNPNKGYATALRNGFLASRTEYTFYTDSDNQFDYADLEKLIPLAPGNDLVVGYRQDRQDAWIRIFVSRCYNLFVSSIFRLGVRDIDCAFKLFRRDVFDKIDIRSQGFLVDTEILVKSRLAGLRLAEVGVRHLPREAGESTVTPWDVVKTLRGIWWLWWTLFTVNWGKLLTGLVISALFIVMLVKSITDFSWSSLPDAFRTINKTSLLLALLAYAASFWLRAWRWQGILSPLVTMRQAALFPSIAVGWAGNNLLPFRVGELLRAYDLGSNRKMSRSMVFGTVVVDRLCDAAALVILLAAGFLLVPELATDRKAVSVFGISVLALLLLLLACIYLASGAGRQGGVIYHIYERFFRSLFQTFRLNGDNFLRGLGVVLNEKVMLRGIAISLLIWCAESLMFYFVFQGFNLDLGLLHSISIACLLNVGLAIPAGPAYIGAYETFLRDALGVFGVLPDRALTYAIFIHLLQFIPITLIGIVFFQRNNWRVVSTKDAE